ncbi:hypothetical protein PIB30_101061 [Stylosanthes scabra]|uniref:Uncharacterized protein n=1 Tax=Stylosanthes scabra TaxID=79078 RepID=A0ABU6VW35_9FABA|nr:hypothetical protein [Stylosanthes scabra]
MDNLSNNGRTLNEIDSIRCKVHHWNSDLVARAAAGLLSPSTKSYNGILSRPKVHCESASGYLVLTAMVHHAYDKLEAEMKEYKAKNNGQAIITHEDGSFFE